MRIVQVLLIAIVCMMVSGCARPWIQAKILSGADTKQAIALEEAQDIKTCDHVTGQGTYLTVTGLVERVQAAGKNVSFQDCLNFLNKTSSPIILPASRPAAESVLPLEPPGQ